MRLWCIALIPRDKLPDEGFMLAYTTRGGGVPQTEAGRKIARWRAWWLPLKGWDAENDCPRPDGPHYRADKDIHNLIEELTEDYIR